MTIQADTGYFYLNSANEIVMKVTWVNPPATVVFIKPDGTQAAGSGFPAADDAFSFKLYADGSLESYTHLGGDGSFTSLKFAQAAPGQGKVFGPNSEYTHGKLVYSETLTPDMVHEVKSFADGNLLTYRFSYGSPETSSVVVTGDYDADTGTSTVSLTNFDHPTPIINVAPGFINNMNGLTASLISDNGAILIGNDGSTLIGNDGSTLIGNDGSTLNQFDTQSLIGNDGLKLIGNDGSTLLNLNGGGNSVIGPPYVLDGGRLIGNDGSTLVGTDPASFAGNVLASVRGFSALSSTSFDDGVDPPVDTLSADISTTGVLDIFGDAVGELETAGDRDWVKVELTAGESYAITVDGADTGDGTLANPDLKLYDAAGTLLAEDADSGTGANAQLFFKPTTSGTYFVEALASGGTGVGTYEIGVHSEASGFIKSGATIDSLTSMRFARGTSIVTLDDGGYAIGFVARIDQQHDAPLNDSFHAQVEIIDADGQVVDLDGRQAFSTMSPDRQPGSYFDNSATGSLQMVANDQGGFTGVLADVFPFDFNNRGPLYRATITHGNEFGMSFPTPITPAATITYPAYMAFGVDIALLANGKYIASMGREGFDGTSVTGTPVQVSINGATAVTVDAETGFNVNNQTTSVSALGNGAVVVWNDAAADPVSARGGATGVLGAVLDASGAVKFTFDVSQNEGEAHYLGSSQAVAELADGGFVVAWMGNELDPNHAVPYTDCYLRVFNADGTPRSDDVVVGESQGGGQSGATVIGLPAGGFAVSWNDNGTVRLQQFDSAGAKIAGEVTVGDGGGQSMTLGPDGDLAIAYIASEQIRVQIMEANQAPTGIVLSDNAIDEGIDDIINPIGKLSAIDGNATDSFTYALVDDAGGLFSLQGDTLFWKVFDRLPDFETQSSYEIQVKVTDSVKASVTKTLTINVTDINEEVLGLEAPTSTAVDELAATGTVVATLVGDDIDLADSFTYQLLNADGLPFSIVEDQLRVSGELDFETKSHYDLTIRVTDSAGHFKDVDFAVDVNDAEENVNPVIEGGPSIAVQIKENQTAAKTMLASDADGDALTFAVVGGDDAELFDVSLLNGEAKLVFKSGPDFENPEDAGLDNIYNVIVRASDGSGGVADQAIAIDVKNVRGIKASGANLTGTDEEDDLSGTNGNDALNGKGGNDFLDGGRGKDRLTGGEGDDIFIFGNRLNKDTTGDNADKILGFSTEDDGFILEGSTFGKIRPRGDFLAENAFVANTTGEAEDSSDRVIYEKNSGRLYFDQDGDGEKFEALLFATVSRKLALTAEHFELG